MFVVFWLLLGALIGLAAAQRKGFSVAGGVIGGILLGPLAFLMFFVSGIAKGDAAKRCPFCAEFIKAAATVCKHCHQAIPASGASAAVERQKPQAMPRASLPPRTDGIGVDLHVVLILAAAVLVSGYLFFVLGI